MTMFEESAVVAQVRGLTLTRLKGWVARGWVRPCLGENGPVYSDLDVARCELVRQLRDDMELDRDTLSLVLSLLDQVYGLRWQLRCTLSAIETLPDEHKRTLRKHIAALQNILDGDG